MFRNNSLPSRLVRFFPLAEVRFGNLPGPLRSLFGLRLHQSDYVRPYQKTLLMGFKWAVYIAHTLADACIKDAVSVFNRIMHSFTTFQLGSISVASKNSHINRLNAGDGCFFHIIDDVNFVAKDWPVKEIVMLHQLIVTKFRRRHLPIKASRSLALGEVELDILPFIGWECNLKTGIIEARKSRLAKVIADSCNLIQKQEILTKEFERTVGRLIWHTLEHRPLLP